MASSGPRVPGAATHDTSVGTAGWMPESGSGDSGLLTCIASNDGLNCIRTVFWEGPTSPRRTYYLKVSTFGFSIPTGATIDGIVVEVYRAGSSTVDNSVKIVKGGSVTGTDKATGTAWSTSPATYGSSTDLWGTTWTAAEINASGFGVAVSAAESAGQANLNHIRITVYYTEAASGNPIPYLMQL